MHEVEHTDQGHSRRNRSKKTTQSSQSFIVPTLFIFGAVGISAAINLWEKSFEQCFEEFDEITRYYLEAACTYFVPLYPPAPWLLDFETLKYPADLPTLVIDCDRVICKLEYDRHTGYQWKKRPHADKFFWELQHYYEIVIYSDDVHPAWWDVMMKWGIPVGGILDRWYCVRHKTHYIKDISKLGRKLERVIHIDHDPNWVVLWPENAIVIKAYDGDEEDNELLDMLEFLK